jgi:hypothetical protein
MKVRLWVGRLRSRAPSESGSAVLFALFACLTVMVSVQMLTVAVICCERALADEASGREGLADVDAAFAHLRSLALTHWEPTPWTPMGISSAALGGRLLGLTEGSDWIMKAEVARGSVPAEATSSALVERGRDGVDLPLAALVAKCVRTADPRATPWLQTADAEGGETPTTEPAVAWLESVQGLPTVGLQCSIRHLETEWSLDEGWAKTVERGAMIGPGIVMISGARGQLIKLQRQEGLGTSERPALVVMSGGGDLDARNLGAYWAVMVADGGSVFLDGTVLRGAVFASEIVDLGGSGEVVYDAEVLRWAADRSFERTRVVPGTRVETTE